MSVPAPQPTWRSVPAYWGPLLVLAAAVPLALLAVHAWRGAGEQRRNAETALRENFAAALKTEARRLSEQLEALRRDAHPPVKLSWFTGETGAPDDWVFGPWPQPESPENRLWEEVAEAARAGRETDAATLLTKLQSALALKPEAASRSGLPLAVLAAHREFLQSPERAPLLSRAVLEHPSPLSAAMLTVLRDSPDPPAELERAWRKAERLESLRRVLQKERVAVMTGAAWAVAAAPDTTNLIHLKRDAETGLLYCLPFDDLKQAADHFGLSPRTAVELQGVALTEAPSSALILAEVTDGPLRLRQWTADGTAFFSGLDAQLAAQRRLIAWAAAFVALALGGLAWVLARQRRLNGMMANFVAAVSHELRSPIASAGLLAERLARGRTAGPEETARYHRLISGECRRLSGLIENVLTFSRIGRGRRDYDFDLADLTEMARRSAALLQPRAAERGVTILEEFPDTPVEIVIDAPAVQQALLNLLDNALKFSPAGGVITLRVRLQADHSTVLEVQDEGPGVPVGEERRVFRLFHRAGSELRRETPGVGIGLAIVHHVARAHRGSVRAENPLTPDKSKTGARFSLILPHRP